MADRWATFDCYGTLIDWNGGIRRELARLFGEDEPTPCSRATTSWSRISRPRTRPARTRECSSDSRLESVDSRERRERRAGALAARLVGLPRGARRALDQARERGFRLAILSNSDPDLIDCLDRRIGVPFDDAIVASEIGSYKPDLGHWRTFEQRHGRLPDVHVGASLFHDIGTGSEARAPVHLDQPARRDAGSGRFRPGSCPTCRA